MERLGHRIKRLRESLGLNQAELAYECGWDYPSRIGNYENENRRLNVEDATVLATALKVTPSELLFGKSEETNYASAKGSLLPLFTNLQQENLSKVNDLLLPEGATEFILYDNLISKSASKVAFALKVKGDFMEPEFKENDIIVIDPLVSPHPGEFVLSKSDDEVIFRKYRTKANKTFELVPLNQDYPIINSDIDNARIIGTMIEHRIYRRKR